MNEILLSLPANLVEKFHELEGVDRDRWFCTCDPVGSKLGSGGGTTWLMNESRRSEAPTMTVEEWLPLKKRVLLHAGGQSRRLPSYATSGKVLTPVPVFDWERGQHLSQNLLSLQLSLYNRIMKQAPDNLHTLIASGDVYIRAEKSLQPIPDADVVCYGLWADATLASHHGVFVMRRDKPEELDYMLQKPQLQDLESITKTHLYLMDIGVWLLSDRAVKLLMQRSAKDDGSGELCYYDMYSQYGLALGHNPRIEDEELNSLKVAILPLPGGEFYHYGTSKELLSSTLALQNKVTDQRRIMHLKVKPNPAIFVQNSLCEFKFTADNQNIWIENSCVGRRWDLKCNHIITGVPTNDWNIALQAGQCVDVVPVHEGMMALRPYGYNDAFKGAINDRNTQFLGMPVTDWMLQRGLTADDISGDKSDIQGARLFPCCETDSDMCTILNWMLSTPADAEGKRLWLAATKLCADELSEKANLERLFKQREEYYKQNLTSLSKNYGKSVFYQLDLANMADEFVKFDIDKPERVSEDADIMVKIHNHMLRSRIMKMRNDKDYLIEADNASSLLREGLMGEFYHDKIQPHLNVRTDQIVWGRSSVRIDVAGGWTDTPPYSLYSGGNVVNFAVELNGQPPLQVYVKPCKDFHVVLRSIDMSASEVVTTYEELWDYKKVGSPFTIPKAALALAGFSHDLQMQKYKTLREQLQDFGSGIELTLLAAIPSGSGLGTSSILAATVLGALNDFCGLAWSKDDICRRTLVLEQLLTTGGGWQDQYGGVLDGVKLLQSEPGFMQRPSVRWLPDKLFTSPQYRECHLLYYSGITRTAKNILGEIVANMFLNSGKSLSLLSEMKAHALDMTEAIQCGDFNAYGALVKETWNENKQLDCGTNPAEIEHLISLIDDYTLGHKLPGAGGGGYLYMVAKDIEAAQRIRKILEDNPLNARARFVEMSLSKQGLQISRS